MKMKKIEIKNYRALRDVTIYPKDILALIGRNNSGKSSVINALELFFEASKSLVEDEIFHGKETEREIEIFVTFEKLNEWERGEFEPWMHGEKLIIGRRVYEENGSYTIDHVAVTRVPEPEWLQEDEINGDNIDRWWLQRDSLEIEGLDFSSTLGTSKPRVGEWKEAAKTFVAENEDGIPWIDKELENPRGYPGVLKGTLPEFIYIPAVREISDEAKIQKTNPFGQLINSILDNISTEKQEQIVRRFKRVYSQLNRIEDEDDGLEGFDRLLEIDEIEERLNAIMSGLMDCEIEIEFPMPEINKIFSEVKIYADDGIKTSIENKGHGTQRMMIFTILRAYADLIREANDEGSTRRTILFAIEEPEIYLHPQSQRILESTLRKIAQGKDQVVFSTHSSLLVNVGHFDEICILRRERGRRRSISHPSQLSVKDLIEDLKARKGVRGTAEGFRELYSHAFNPMVNEGFFADKVVIVEGPSEGYSLPIYSKTCGYDLNENNIAVVHSNGKGSIDRLLRIFNGFKIPTYVWFDGDKNNEDEQVKKKSLELLQLLGNPLENIEELETIVKGNFAVFENKLEDTLETEIDEYEEILGEATDKLGPIGKPLKQRFLAQKLNQYVNDGRDIEDLLPKTILEIIAKIEELTYSGSILQKSD